MYAQQFKGFAQDVLLLSDSPVPNKNDMLGYT